MAQSSVATGPNLERRTVVSVLIFPSQPYASKPYRVLLFRRSDRVRTYQGKLAPIAGSVEAEDESPLAAAWRELKEETGFGPQQLDLWRRGAGFEFTDEKAVSGLHGGQYKGRIWKVWPFAFRLKDTVPDLDKNVDELGLKLDWEHTGCEWRDIDDVLGGRILGDCVARLDVTLRQLWVDLDGALYHELERLRLDHEHGARELATMAVRSTIKIVEHYQKEQQGVKPRTWWKDIQRQAFHLAFNGRPSMGAAISSAVITALEAARPRGDTLEPGDLNRVKQSLEAYLAQRGEISKRMSEQFSQFLHQRFSTKGQVQNDARKGIKILTLSSSSTIKAAILHALDTDESLSIELRILESRPLNEGARFADALTKEMQKRCGSADTNAHARDRLRLVLASDASVGILSKGVEIVLIGADRISENGDVSNKTGTLAAALVSKSVTNGSVDVVCISESEKIAGTGTTEEHVEEENDENELTSSWHVERSTLWRQMVTVRNIYFEWCPGEMIDHYICEDGTLSTLDIRQRSKAMSERIGKVFPFEQI